MVIHWHAFLLLRSCCPTDPADDKVYIHKQSAAGSAPDCLSLFLALKVLASHPPPPPFSPTLLPPSLCRRAPTSPDTPLSLLPSCYMHASLSAPRLLFTHTHKHTECFVPPICRPPPHLPALSFLRIFLSSVCLRFYLFLSHAVCLRASLSLSLCDCLPPPLPRAYRTFNMCSGRWLLCCLSEGGSFLRGEREGREAGVGVCTEKEELFFFRRWGVTTAL